MNDEVWDGTDVAAGEPAQSVVAFPDLAVAAARLPLVHTQAFTVVPD